MWESRRRLVATICVARSVMDSLEFRPFAPCKHGEREKSSLNDFMKLGVSHEYEVNPMVVWEEIRVFCTVCTLSTHNAERGMPYSVVSVYRLGLGLGFGLGLLDVNEL